MSQAQAVAEAEAPEGGAAGAIEPVTLTPKQKSDWEQTMSLMLWTCPGFRHLFYKLLVNNDGEYGCVPTRDPSCPVAATDQQNIMINPDTFFTYNMKERVFIMGHEVVHNVYGDVDFLKRCFAQDYVLMNDGTQIPFREETMQKAMDYRINALLRDSNIGSPPKDCCLDDTIAKANDSVTEVYKRVYEDEESGGHKTGKHRPHGRVLKPGASNGKGAGKNNQQWAVEIQAAQTLEALKAQGRGMANGLKKFFNDILNPVVPWTEYIRGIFNRKVGNGSWDWKRPDRRLIVRDVYMPSRSGHGAGWVVCWGDTSGSVIAEVNRYLPELQGILEDCQPQRLTIVWCDDGVQRVDELSEACDLEQTKGEGAPGGGGTSVEPVFEWISEQQEMPEVFIGFTDGYVDFVDPPPIPVVIWAMTTNVVAPYGESVSIKEGVRIHDDAEA
jgi:predicted metal-dependent peptidase